MQGLAMLAIPWYRLRILHRNMITSACVVRKVCEKKKSVVYLGNERKERAVAKELIIFC